ncbi:hypothetical protein CC80DRAFT_597481 [Byssothecium circinans]|uniref:Uncharacterized protein n=1 Tax=Byssothecium circinans TaxID=147558 RepID=A0A6A5TG57_9PLEO|nr:hypothetical protein CC80DRAFT_597481 [Byssothecium circinans]
MTFTPMTFSFSPSSSVLSPCSTPQDPTIPHRRESRVSESTAEKAKSQKLTRHDTLTFSQIHSPLMAHGSMGFGTFGSGFDARRSVGVGVEEEKKMRRVICHLHPQSHPAFPIDMTEKEELQDPSAIPLPCTHRGREKAGKGTQANGTPADADTQEKQVYERQSDAEDPGRHRGPSSQATEAKKGFVV